MSVRKQSSIEIWKPIPDCFGYSASNFGRIRSDERYVERVVTKGEKVTKHLKLIKERILKFFKTKNGYLQVSLRVGGKYKVSYIHDLVIRAFTGPPPQPKDQCRHKDGIKTNCAESNLKWGSCKKNHADMQRHGTTKTGIRSGTAKLTIKQVLNMRKDRQKGLSIYALEVKYQISNQQCSDICNYKNWDPTKWIRDLKQMLTDGREHTEAFILRLKEAKILLREKRHPNYNRLKKRLRSLDSLQPAI